MLDRALGPLGRELVVAVHVPAQLFIAHAIEFGILNGFASSTGSSSCQMASVGQWSRLNNATPSLHLHYKASPLLWVAPHLRSASVLSPSRLEPLVASSLASENRTSHVPCKSLTALRVAYMPDAVRAVS
jgi:hypothetical protein